MAIEITQSGDIECMTPHQENIFAECVDKLTIVINTQAVGTIGLYMHCKELLTQAFGSTNAATILDCAFETASWVYNRELAWSEELETFENEYTKGLKDYFLALDEVGVMGIIFASLDPYSMDVLDKREFNSLHPDEIDIVEKVLASELDVRRGSAIDFYYTSDPKSNPKSDKLKVFIYQTNQRNVFLHEIIDTEGLHVWAIGPNTHL